MPKLVDHARRRREIAEVVWSLAADGGLADASLREVASRGGWSLGALRHYAASREEMLAIGLDELVAAAGARITEALRGVEGEREVLERTLEQLLPLDDARRTELRVWLQYMLGGDASPGLGALRVRAYETLVGAVEGLLGKLRPHWGVGARRARAERFVALGDGLALQALAGGRLSDAELAAHVRVVATVTLAPPD